MSAYQNLTLPQVQKFALKLALALRGKKATIGLVGNLGSGKTTFTKAFAKAFKIHKISSPTFVIVHRYKIPRRFFYHVDLYRLHSAKQLMPLGLGEILNGQNVALIEWADKFLAVKKQCDILITFKVKKNNKRDVTIKTL